MATTEPAPKIAAAKASKPVAKEKKAATSKPKSIKNASHPPYFEMIKDALLTLKEKGGSSPYAIGKFIEDKQKAALPANFKKILGQQLKNSAAKGKLIKVKASYKLSEAVKKDKKAVPKKANQIVDGAAKPEKKKSEKAKNIVQAAAAKPKKAEEAVKKKAATPVKKEAVKKKKKAATPVKKAAKAKALAKTKAKQPKSIKSPVKKAKKTGA